MEINWGLWIRTAVILFITFFLVYLVRKFFEGLNKKAQNQSLHNKFLQSILTVSITVIGVYSALGSFEIAREISTTVLQSSALLIAVATFAAQQTLGNVISGFSLSSSKPCEIGQKVQIRSGGTVIAEGFVRDMTARHFVIEQVDGQICIVPNSVVDGAVIVNMSNPDEIATFVSVEVDYGTDVAKAEEVIGGILASEPLVVNKGKTKVLVSDLTANGMLLKFAVFTKDVNDSYEACSNVRRRIVEEFAKAEILIPYNTITIDASDAIVQSSQMQMAMNQAMNDEAKKDIPPENPVEGFEQDHYAEKPKKSETSADSGEQAEPESSDGGDEQAKPESPDGGEEQVEPENTDGEDGQAEPESSDGGGQQTAAPGPEKQEK